jgi:protein involved in polysaccharide export with SLBB domain
MKTLTRAFIATAVLAFLAHVTIAQENANHPAEASASTPTLAEGRDYRVRPGDQLDIKFFYQPELNDQVIVRPDGHLSMQLVSDIKAEGLTIPELTNQITAAYSGELRQPQISIILRATGARIYIDGEVNRPGPLVYLSRMNILQAVSEAGGLKETARVEQVLVIRPNSDAPPTIFAVNYKKALAGDLHEMAILRPADIVVVPRSRVSNVNRWVDQYLRKNVPIPVTLGWIP